MTTTMTTDTKLAGLLLEAARARDRWQALGDERAQELESEPLDLAALLRQRGPDRKGRTGGFLN